MDLSAAYVGSCREKAISDAETSLEPEAVKSAALQEQQQQQQQHPPIQCNHLCQAFVHGLMQHMTLSPAQNCRKEAEESSTAPNARQAVIQIEAPTSGQ